MILEASMTKIYNLTRLNYNSDEWKRDNTLKMFQEVSAEWIPLVIDSTVDLLFQLTDKQVILSLDGRQVNTTVAYEQGKVTSVKTENVVLVNVQYQELRGICLVEF